MHIYAKFTIALVLCMLISILIINLPVIIAHFDADQYVDGEAFIPQNSQYDFRLFTLNSSDSKNYTATIAGSGYCQLVDNRGNNTINVLEWNKMSLTQKGIVNSSIYGEFENPSHMASGIRVFDIDFLGHHLYASYLTNSDESIMIYIATPSENETVEMIKTLKFKEDFK